MYGDPEGGLCHFDHFAAGSDQSQLVDFHRTVAKVCAILGLTGEDGFRAISDAGVHGMQEVPHSPPAYPGRAGPGADAGTRLNPQARSPSRGRAPSSGKSGG